MERNTAFNAKARLYDRFRWRYPREALDWIASVCGIGPESTVADIGAGTGILTEALDGMAKTVYAVEPDPNMAAVLREKGLSNVMIIERFAHELDGIPDGFLGAILAAHALHWFDAERALPAFARKLAPAGWLVDVNNRPNGASEIDEAELEALGNFKRSPAASVRPKATPKPIEYFEAGTKVEREFPFLLRHDFESYLGALASASYYPGECDGDSWEGFREATRSLFDRYAPSGRMESKCVTKVTIGRLAGASRA